MSSTKRPAGNRPWWEQGGPLAALVLLAWALVYLCFLGVRPLFTPDETRYGLIGWEMLNTDGWFNLRMDGFRYYEKPPLVYWLIAVSFKQFGVTAWALRLPMAMATLGTSAMVALLVWRWRANATMAAVAALAGMFMLLPAITGTLAVLDSVFSAMVCATLVCFYLGARSGTVHPQRWLALAGVAAALAVLSKGFLGLALPAMVAAPWLVWQRRWRGLFTLPIIPVLAAVVTVAVPAWLIHRHEPQFWHEFFWTEHVRRFTQADVNQHAQPWWLLIVLLPFAALPWSVVTHEAVQGLWQREHDRDTVRFLICWVAMPLLFFSASSGKLVTYILPIFPAVAALLAVGLWEWYSTAAGREALAKVRLSGVVAVLVGALVVGLALTLGLGFGVHLLSRLGLDPALDTLNATRLWPTSPWLHVGGAMAALVAWAMLEFISQRQIAVPRRLLLSALAPAPVLAMIPLLMSGMTLPPGKSPEAALAPHMDRLRDAGQVITNDVMTHAAALLGKRTDVAIVGGVGEFDNELGDASEQARLVQWAELPGYIAAKRREGSVLLIVSAGSPPAEKLAAKAPGMITLEERPDWLVAWWAAAD